MATYEEEKAIRDARPIETTYGMIDHLFKSLRDAEASIRVFYPAANWNERKGMAILIDELNEAQERCLELMRPVLNPADEAMRLSLGMGE